MEFFYIIGIGQDTEVGQAEEIKSNTLPVSKPREHNSFRSSVLARLKLASIPLKNPHQIE
jgi:hypothetical protein